MIGKTRTRFFSLLAGFSLLAVGLLFSLLVFKSPDWAPIAWADETSEPSESYEDSEGSEGGSDEEDKNETEEASPEYVTRYRTVTKVITLTEPGYDIDSDRDIIVDAIDPDPTRHQEEYFTDTDDDSVPNVFDQYHDENDFVYFESAFDDDHDGVIDSLEQE